MFSQYFLNISMHIIFIYINSMCMDIFDDVMQHGCGRGRTHDPDLNLLAADAHVASALAQQTGTVAR